MPVKPRTPLKVRFPGVIALKTLRSSDVCLKGHFIYVCLLMDVFTRMFRTWHISQHLTQSLTLKPLEAALRQSVPEIHHSDQDIQYLSNAYVSLLKHHRIEISVVRRGHPWENGYAERLIRPLKEEEVHLNDYEDIHEAKARIGHFIIQVEVPSIF